MFLILINRILKTKKARILLLIKNLTNLLKKILRNKKNRKKTPQNLKIQNLTQVIIDQAKNLTLLSQIKVKLELFTKLTNRPEKLKSKKLEN